MTKVVFYFKTLASLLAVLSRLQTEQLWAAQEQAKSHMWLASHRFATHVSDHGLAGWLALHVLFLQHLISVPHQLLLRRTPLPHFMPVSNTYPKTTKLLKTWSVHSLSGHLTKVVLPVHLYKVHKKLEARTSLPVLQVINWDSHSSRGCGFPCMCT